MPSRDHLINKVRSLGFKFKRQAPHVDFYKRGTQRVAIQRSMIYLEDYCRSILRQCGCTEPEIQEFIKSCKS